MPPPPPPPQPADPAALPAAEQQRRLSELQRRLTGTRLSEDFANGAPDALLLRYLGARGFDVDKALAVRAGCALCAAAQRALGAQVGEFVRPRTASHAAAPPRLLWRHYLAGRAAARYQLLGARTP
jgi:hypothetical protein